MTEVPIIMETSPLIYKANQWTGFYMIRISAMKELIGGRVLVDFTIIGLYHVYFFCDFSKLFRINVLQKPYELLTVFIFLQCCFRWTLLGGKQDLQSVSPWSS